jgi:hypothetical protein
VASLWPHTKLTPVSVDFNGLTSRISASCDPDRAHKAATLRASVVAAIRPVRASRIVEPLRAAIRATVGVVRRVGGPDARARRRDVTGTARGFRPSPAAPGRRPRRASRRGGRPAPRSRRRGCSCRLPALTHSRAAANAVESCSALSGCAVAPSSEPARRTRRARGRGGRERARRRRAASRARSDVAGRRRQRPARRCSRPPRRTRSRAPV